MNTLNNLTVNPEGRNLKLKQEFDSNVSKFFKEFQRSEKETNILMLLCPAYPHDGQKFTYSLWRS